MKVWKVIAIGSLLLWVATIGVAGFFFAKGITSEGEDGRTIVNFNKEEVTFTLTEMRGLLETVSEIVSAANDNDMKGVGEAVKGKGVADMLKNTPKSILAKLPMDFRSLGMDMHRGFDGIGKAAANNAGKDEVLKLVGKQIERCTACHASFSLPR